MKHEHKGSDASQAQPAADRGVRNALEAARQWIGSAPHDDNCFLLNDGGEYDACFCGKDGIETQIDAALAEPVAAVAQPAAEPHPCEEAARADLIDELQSMREAFDEAGTFHYTISRAIAWINGEQASAEPRQDSVHAVESGGTTLPLGD